jgi:hypothetical protein
MGKHPGIGFGVDLVGLFVSPRNANSTSRGVIRHRKYVMHRGRTNHRDTKSTETLKAPRRPVRAAVRNSSSLGVLRASVVFFLCPREEQAPRRRKAPMGAERPPCRGGGELMSRRKSRWRNNLTTIDENGKLPEEGPAQSLPAKINSTNSLCRELSWCHQRLRFRSEREQRCRAD